MPAGRTNVGRVQAGVWRSDRRATVAMGGRAGCAGGSDMWVAGDMWSGEVGAGGRWSGGLPSSGPDPPAPLCILIRTYADIRTVRPLRKHTALI